MQLALSKLTAALSLQRQVVGITFLPDQIDYDSYPLETARAKTSYCVMVKLATHGYAMKSGLAQHACDGGTRALGLEPPSPDFLSGEEYSCFGLYENQQVAKQVAQQITLCNPVYGIAVQPLSTCINLPDVVLIVCNSYNAMRIIQGYTYYYGTNTAFKTAGNQAVCAECTAFPFQADTINVSFFCAGTRHLAGWGEDEVCIGLPYERFLKTCEGVYQSINGAEPNKTKDVIRRNIKKNELPDPGIQDDEAYFIRFK